MIGLSVGNSPVSAIYRGAAQLWSWTPDLLFAGGLPGMWLRSSRQDLLYQDLAGLTPATIGQTVALIRRAAGTVDATQATALSRPWLARWPKGGRRNLLNYSEDMSNAVWFKSGASISGTKIVESAANTTHFVQQGATLLAANYVFRGEFMRDGRDWVRLQFGSPAKFAFFNLITGETATLAAGTTATATLTDDGWWRCQISGATDAASSAASVNLAPATNTGAYQGDGVSGVRYRNLMLEQASTSTAYQRVTSANDITEAGRPDIWHLWNDGGDSINAAAMPAGTYGLAYVDVLGNITTTTVTSDGSTPINLLRTERQVDAVIRQGAFTAAEIAQLTQYWGYLK